MGRCDYGATFSAPIQPGCRTLRTAVDRRCGRSRCSFENRTGGTLARIHPSLFRPGYPNIRLFCTTRIQMAFSRRRL